MYNPFHMAPERNISSDREALFAAAEKKLHYTAKIYRLGDQFKELPLEIAAIYVLDVTEVPGCHYGLNNVFVPIIKNLENNGINVGDQKIAVLPETTILVEPSTGNGWVAFSDAANELGYEHIIVMPDGLPEARYKHPQGRKVTIIKTPKEDYALGMPIQLKKLISENPGRLVHGEKIYVSPNHPIGAANITVEAMSELGRQLMNNIGDQQSPIRVVVSMGNGASLCALGEYVKSHANNSRVVATESFAYGGGFERFAQIKETPRYKDLFGIDPGNEALMSFFSAFGTNAPIGIELPLQVRAMSRKLIDNYVLFTDNSVLIAYRRLNPSDNHLNNALSLPNSSQLPRSLYERFGNSTLANIAVALKYTGKRELVVAMAYDGRGNY